jgi:hypothetical protein
MTGEHMAPCHPPPFMLTVAVPCAVRHARVMLEALRTEFNAEHHKRFPNLLPQETQEKGLRSRQTQAQAFGQSEDHDESRLPCSRFSNAYCSPLGPMPS